MSTSLPPSASTFSFTAPYPSTPSSSSTPASLKQQRRVSLALPSSPRQFPAWSFRDDTTVGVGMSSSTALVPEKKGKIRRIASDTDEVEEAFLNPSTPGPSLLSSQGLSSSSAPAEPLKKPRKKWTAEETQMLVDGCNKWGVGNWKTILNDAELKFDNRSPVDLKDRFRTYFPDAYKHHYPNARTHLSTKTRSTHPDGSPLFCASRSKKRRPFTPEEDAALKAGYDKHGTVWATIVKDPVFQQQNRRSTDLRDRFRNAWPDLYARAGYKPRAAVVKKKKTGRVHPVRAATDDQLPTTSATGGPIRRKRRHTTQGFGLFRGGTKSVPESTATSEDEDSESEDEGEASHTPDTPGPSKVDMNMDMSSQDIGMPDFASTSSLSMSDMTDSSQSQSQSMIASWPDLERSSNVWSSSRTPGAAYAESLAASPTPSTDYILPNSPVGLASNSMIGKSAWGTQDWLSPNPRLDASGVSANNSNSFSGIFSPSPMGSPTAYPLSLPGSHPHSIGGYSHSHGVLDRYDLFPMSHDLDLDLDFVSEGFGGAGDAHSAFSDPSAGAGASDMRRGGFTHHSNYAGDLIFGARTHQPSGNHRMDYGPGFGFGLGLEEGHPSSVLHTPNLPGIDEIELTNITLNDPRESDQDLPLSMTIEESSQSLTSTSPTDIGVTAVTSPAMSLQDSFPGLALDELVGIPSSDPIEETLSQNAADTTPDTSHHDTPPATPAQGYRMSARAPSGSSAHHRSISVPPSEHRAFIPPRTGQSQAVSPRAKQKYFMTTPTRAAFGPLPLPPTPIPLPPTNPTPLVGNSWPYVPITDNNTYQVPFLDLHYYYPPSNDPQMMPNLSAGESRPLTSQALDLARTIARSMGPPLVDNTKPLCIQPSLMQLIPDGTPGNAHSRMHSNHHRGQSVTAVSPQDLDLRKGNDNKRKRASWDGGPR
ncbi:hypothetical protein BDY19DRAFT_884381 [Irpex rosettiformis]|uniref:Uncharacterized protein n=1 Tax=Irpex rosettiformis TaxID=378272 RepID=A0ACB8UDR4_9APHY|nr:hypothetical protein BDY19DRAFT_884381 [Irpex rosettiformis]